VKVVLELTFSNKLIANTVKIGCFNGDRRE